MGLDPVFSPKATLYDVSLAPYPQLWYNVSAVKQSVDPNRMPFGFQYVPEAVIGTEIGDGYPVYIAAGLPRARVQQYLNKELTRTMTASAVIYNPDLRVFGLWEGQFSWDSVITLKQTFKALPAIDYSRYIASQQYWRFIPDWIMILFTIGYVLGAAYDIGRSLNAQHRIMDADVQPAVQLTREELHARQQRAKRVYRERATPFWMLYEGAVGVLMLTALVLLYVYVFYQSPNAPIKSTFDVYDADAFAPANMFLLRKDQARYDPEQMQQLKAATSMMALLNAERLGLPSVPSAWTKLVSSGMPQPGTPFRWALPDDLGPLKDLGYMFKQYWTMHRTYVWYGVLQSVVLLLLMLRLINKVAFQPRLSIISGTLAYFLPDFLHFMGVLIFVIALLAAICNLVFGYRMLAMSSFGSALATLLQYMFTGVNTVSTDSFSVSIIIPRNLVLHPAEQALCLITVLIFPLFFIMVLYMFIVAMLLVPLKLLRRSNKDASGIFEDLAARLRWAFQRAWHAAPMNKELDQRLDWLLLPQIQQSWWFHQVYSAVVRANMRAQFAPSQKRRMQGKLHRVLDVHMPHIQRYHMQYTHKKLA
ncbi:uncharacterized protein HaLaN_27681, partial [Haematococcus lacustris]